MYEVKYHASKKNKELRSLGLFVGSGKCNARCAHCAGVPLRKYAPKDDGDDNFSLINKTAKLCYDRGARYLSITSSGEPTLSPRSVTRVLEDISDIGYKTINLYSNGIRIGSERSFCKDNLSYWSSLGLKNIYLTVHDIDVQRNAKIYGVDSYPELDVIISQIHRANISVRANLVLGKNIVDSFDKFCYIVDGLNRLGVDMISAWPLRTLDDKLDRTNGIDESELSKIEKFAKKNINVMNEKTRTDYESKIKLTLFPDGTLSNSWCK